MTSDYLFINSSACEISNNQYKIILSQNNNRPQTQIIELISIALSSAEEQPYLQVRAGINPSNYEGNDKYAPCIGILTKDYSVGDPAAVHNYIMSAIEAP